MHQPACVKRIPLPVGYILSLLDNRQISFELIQCKCQRKQIVFLTSNNCTRTSFFFASLLVCFYNALPHYLYAKMLMHNNVKYTDVKANPKGSSTYLLMLKLAMF